MLTSRQYTIVTGTVASLTWTHNGVFRRGTTLRWRSYTLDPGMGAPYVWMVSVCPSSDRLFIQPPRFPVEELREMVREAVNRSIGRPHLTFSWPDEEA